MQSLVKKYHIVLRNAKVEKLRNHQYANGGLSAALADAYDEMLTRDEIQEHVNKVRSEMLYISNYLRIMA